MKTKRKPDAKRPPLKPDDPAQSRRFVETAREIDADESGEAFRRAFEKIVPPKRKTRTRRPRQE
jgi:hypothetical protein